MTDNKAFSSSSVIRHLSSVDAAMTQRLAAAIAGQCRRGDCILLRGDLGAGKTTFARGFIQSLQLSPDEVVSPTFTLVQTYPARGGNTIWHFDLYRLENSGEVAEIGLEEALNDGITLIEWPELVESRLPEETLNVTIEMPGPQDHRRLTFSSASKSWQDRLTVVKEKI